MIRKDTESDWKWKETVCAYLKGCLPSGLCFSALVCGLFYVCTCTWNHIDIQMAYTTMNTRRLTRLWFYQCAGCGEMFQQDICHFWGLNYTSTCDSICEMSIQSPRTYHRAARNSQTTFRRHWEAAFPSTLLEHLVTLNFLWTLGERARTNRRFFETFITTRCIPKSIWSSNSNRAVDTGASPLSLPFTLPIAVRGKKGFVRDLAHTSVCSSLYLLTRAHCAQCSPWFLCSWHCTYLFTPAEGRTQSPDWRIPVSHDRWRACLFNLLVYQAFWAWCRSRFRPLIPVTHHKVIMLKLPIRTSNFERTDDAFVMLICFCVFKL